MGGPAARLGMYLLTVRGETLIASLSRSLLAMHSSPQGGLSVAMRRINWRSSNGMGGRPGLDL